MINPNGASGSNGDSGVGLSLETRIPGGSPAGITGKITAAVHFAGE